MRIVIVSPSAKVNPVIFKHTRHLYTALGGITGNEVRFLQLDKGEGHTGKAPEFISDYEALAGEINASADVCILQYHAEAYHGKYARFILAMVQNLTVPLYSVFHTVNNNPADDEKALAQILACCSERIMAKSHLALDFLEHFYKLGQDQLMVMESGIPEPDFEGADKVLGMEPGPVLVSFGGLAGGRGYETVINALPGILNHYPNLRYVILGDTGPEEFEERGEEYLKSLRLLARRRRVSDKVRFICPPPDDSVVSAIMRKADLFISSATDEHALSDDNLTMALASGAVVLSTPTWYARALLDEQRGQLFPFKSSTELSHMVVNTLRSSRERETYRQTALLFGAQLSWGNIANRLNKELHAGSGAAIDKKVTPMQLLPALLPDWKPDHLLSLTDNTGILDSSVYGITDYKAGYSLEGNAMLIQVLAMAQEHGVQAKKYDRMLKRSLSFVKYMLNDDGTLSKALSYTGEKCREGDEFAGGRAAWALGELYKRSQSAKIKDVAYSLLYRLLLKNGASATVEGKAMAVIAASLVLEAGSPDPELYELVTRHANGILRMLPSETASQSYWHEKTLSRRFGLIPLALAYAYKVSGDQQCLTASRRLCRFVEKLMFTDMVFNPALSGHPVDRLKLVRTGEQDSEEAYLMVACYAKLYQITNEPVYLNQLHKTHVWYLGENNQNRALYDYGGGGCFAGLGQRGVEPQKGVRSTCSHWLSHFTYMDAYFWELKDSCQP